MKRPNPVLRNAAAAAAVTAAALAFAAWLVRQPFYSNASGRIFSPLHLVFEAVAFGLAGFLVFDGCRARDAGWRPRLRAATGLGIAALHVTVLVAGGYPS